jgi:hypothetical protein
MSLDNVLFINAERQGGRDRPPHPTISSILL